MANDIVSIIAKVALKYGIEPDDLWIPIGIALGESGWDPSRQGDEGHSIGLFQLHDKGVGVGMSVEERNNPWVNAERIMPAIVSALKAKERGLYGFDLFREVWLVAENPRRGPDTDTNIQNTYDSLLTDYGDDLLSSIDPALLESIPWGATTFSTGGVTQKETGKFNWGKLNLDQFLSEGGSIADYYAALTTVVTPYAMIGQPLPEGAPIEAQSIYAAYKKKFELEQPSPEDVDLARKQTQAGLDLNLANIAEIKQAISQSSQLFPYQLKELQNKIARGEQLTPIEVEQAKVTLDKMRQEYDQSGQKFPVELDLLKQSLRLGEPFGQESILRSESGKKGYRDYWSGKGPDQSKSADADYMAGYRLGESEEHPQKQTDLITTMNAIIEQVSQGITASGQRADNAAAEFKRRLDAFDLAGQQYQTALPFSLRPGAEFIPGFQPGSPGARYAGSPEEGIRASTVKYDPYAIALETLNQTPNIADIPVPDAGVPDLDLFRRALAMQSTGVV